MTNQDEREQAEAAHTPGGPSVDELEAEIRERRGLQMNLSEVPHPDREET